MKNRINIKGDHNINVNNVKDSNIKINEKNVPNSKNERLWVILGTAIALIALTIQVLTGWGDLLNFFE